MNGACGFGLPTFFLLHFKPFTANIIDIDFNDGYACVSDSFFVVSAGSPSYFRTYIGTMNSFEPLPDIPGREANPEDRQMVLGCTSDRMWYGLENDVRTNFLPLPPPKRIVCLDISYYIYKHYCNK